VTARAGIRSGYLPACAWMPIELYFPAKGQTAAAARAICSTCKVQPDCLDYARADTDTMGFWGGTRNANGATMERWRDYNATTTPGLT
jgi:hypothetical protein